MTEKAIKMMENIEKYRSYIPIEYGYHSNGGRGYSKIATPPCIAAVCFFSPAGNLGKTALIFSVLQIGEVLNLWSLL